MPIISGSQSVQTQGVQSIIALNATYTSGGVSFTGVGGGVTVSSNTGQRVDISVAAPVAQTAQTGISSIAASNTTYTSGGITITGSNMVTVRSTTGQGIVIDATQTVQVVQSALAASNTTYTSGLVTITGVGGGVTVSSNTGQRIDISVAAPVAQSVQTQNMVAVSATNTLYSSGTVLFTGSNMITVKSSGAGQTIILDATQSVQVVQSALAASNTTYTSGLVTITGVGGGVTVSSNTGQRIDISVAAPVAQTVQTQNLIDVTLSGNTSGALALVSSGTLTLAGGNNITLSQAGNAITISGAAAGGAQTAISGIVASNATYTSGTVTFTGVGGGVTVSSNTGQRIDISVAAQSVQTQNMVAVSATNTLYSSGTVLFTGSNMITVKSSGAGQTIILDATQSVQIVQSAIAASNTTYTSGLVTFTGVGGGVTVQSNTGQRVDISVATPVNFSAGVSNLGNTQGATGASGTQLVLVGTNGITLSQTTGANGLTISISGGAGGGGGVNIAASNTTYTSGTAVFSASDSYRSAISIASVGAQSVIVSDAGPQLAYWERAPMVFSNTSQVDLGTVLHVVPLVLNGENRFPGRMTASIARVVLSYNGSSSAGVSAQLSSTMKLFLYTRSSDSLSLLNSGSMTYGNTVATSNNSVHWNGAIALDISATSAWSVRPDLLYGGEYYLGVQFNTHITTGGAGNGPFFMLAGGATSSAFANLIKASPATNITRLNPRPFWGSITLTASNHIRTTVAHTDVSWSQAGPSFFCEPFVAFYESTQLT